MVKLGKSNTRTRTKKGTRNKQTANKQTTKRIIHIKRKKLLDQKESGFGKLLSC